MSRCINGMPMLRPWHDKGVLVVRLWYATGVLMVRQWCAKASLCPLTWAPGMNLSWKTEELGLAPTLLLAGKRASVPRRNLGSEAWM